MIGWFVDNFWFLAKVYIAVAAFSLSKGAVTSLYEKAKAWFSDL